MKLLNVFSLVAEYVVGMIILWSFYAVLVLNDVAVFDENNLLENTQAVTLAITLVLFTVPLFDRSRNDRLLAIFFAFLALGFILRELDIEKLGLPNVLVVLGSGEGRNLLLATGLLSTLGYALFKFRFYLDLAQMFIRSSTGLTTLLAGFFLVVGDFFEKAKIPHHVLFEESLELIGYALLMWAASLLAQYEVKTRRVI